MECEIITTLWLAKLHLEDSPLDDKSAWVYSKRFLPEEFTGGVLEGFGPSKKTLKPDAVPSFSAMRHH